jgi:hypothetical protein
MVFNAQPHEDSRPRSSRRRDGDVAAAGHDARRRARRKPAYTVGGDGGAVSISLAPTRARCSFPAKGRSSRKIDAMASVVVRDLHKKFGRRTS